MPKKRLKKIKGFEIYYICPYGRGIYSTRSERFLLIEYNTKGYAMTKVYDRKQSKAIFLFLHRIVATHFCRRKKGQSVVHHQDFDKGNFWAYNLRWLTEKEHTRIHKKGLKVIHKKHHLKKKIKIEAYCPF